MLEVHGLKETVLIIRIDLLCFEKEEIYAEKKLEQKVSWHFVSGNIAI